MRALSPGLQCGLCLMIAAPAASALAASPQKTPETVVYAFKGETDGANPNGLIAGPGGVLYGTTPFNATPNSASTVFELDPPAVGTTAWTKKSLVTFPGPQYLSPISELLRDASGNLYGVAVSNTDEGGFVFRLGPPASGHAQWVLTTLYTFPSADGGPPAGGLVMDAGGALVGANGGGAYSAGQIFELRSPSGGQGPWRKTILYSFEGGTDGAGPIGHPTLGAGGSYYGMIGYGGSPSNAGGVFKLSPPSPGGTQWTESVLYRFDGDDGDDPVGSLVVDHAGALYGTTYLGGLGLGNVFRLAPPTPGHAAWTETVLHRFSGGYDGAAPAGGLSIDHKGFLYGTASQGGGYYGAGTAFRLDPPQASGATDRFAVLHTFDGTLAKLENSILVYFPSPFDGASPTTPPVPVRGPSGATVLFGVTFEGGTPFNLTKGNGLGAVYKIAP